MNKSRLQEKCFLWLFWNSWNFPRKKSITKSLLSIKHDKIIIENLHASKKSQLIHFSENVRETSVLKVLENSHKNVVSIVPYKQFEQSNLPPITLLKSDSTEMFPTSVMKIFNIAARTTVLKSLFGIFTGHITCTDMVQNATLLDVSCQWVHLTESG